MCSRSCHFPLHCCKLMHSVHADPPSKASAAQVLFKKMEASVKQSLFYPPLRQFQDINDLLIANTDIQYCKTVGIKYDQYVYVFIHTHFGAGWSLRSYLSHWLWQQMVLCKTIKIPVLVTVIESL